MDFIKNHQIFLLLTLSSLNLFYNEFWIVFKQKEQ